MLAADTVNYNPYGYYYGGGGGGGPEWSEPAM